ncbi:Inner membrane protein YqiK [Gemmata obscuriglobus]|uniref:Flotillin family protein n=1 Tax=Gemmata obscuriglobus TaxID=114 RepID=A0A2Z3HGH1_9BACT|nr:flotillin family protein [Gemmata obscuriglobus]AWM40904.1 flotillin family protein [Gemmata obscuriglobus]QEG25796.1 Inner membrane protein YqiK [Gemmata obscuriglobus]VTR99667.1 Flotillin-like protein OS=Blastopirellula marina DSM 3645 GN=DSM3645_05480 PE=4 SV=1: Band_7 [Gemmata obscuriglobus UQM 2246]
MLTHTLLAQQKPVPAEVPWPAITALAAGLVLFGLLMLVAKRYKRCPSNRVLVIYGKTGGGNAAKCVHGGAAFVVPLIQDYSYLNLDPIQIEVPLKGALSIENIRVNVPSVFTVAIGTDPETMQNAAIRLLDLGTQEIKEQARDIIFGQLRQVIASMRIEDINRDRDKFLESVQKSLEPELKKIGLVLINVNITDITDESGYIEAIGRKAAAIAIQQAKIDVAEQEKKGQIGVAEAERERAISVANATKVREIGTREATREQAIKVAQLEKDREVGEQTAQLEQDALIKEAQRQQAIRIAELDRDQRVGEQQAVFEREARIAEAERDKRVRLAEANAKAVTGEAVAQADVAGAQATLAVRNAEAYQLAETKKREAEAAVLEAQNRALARAALAQAEKVEAEQRAALEAPAKAQKAKMIVDAEAAAERVKLEAEAQAATIYAKLEAEARGQFEILAKKGEGLKKIIEACGSPQAAFQLLMLEHMDALAEASAKAISNVKFDKVVVWEGGGNGTGTSNTAGFLKDMAKMMPPMMQVMKDIGGVELPEYFARLTGDTSTEPKPSANGTHAV